MDPETTRIIDLGMGTFRRKPLDCGASGTLICGRYFAAPEDVFGTHGPDTDTAPADVWALAVMILEAKLGMCLTRFHV